VKLGSDNASKTDRRVPGTRLKVTGGVLAIIGLALLVLNQYWAPYVANLLYRLRIEPANVQNILYILGYSPYLLFAVGGFMVLKSQKKPLRPDPKETEEERI
jgi:hypothetical protein